MTSLMVDYALGGWPDDLFAFHRTSLIFHVLMTGAAMIFLYRLFGNPWAAAVASLLFSVHPLTVEPVAWVADRKTLLATVFTFAALAAYAGFARKGGRVRYLSVLVFDILALLSKPTALPLPILLCLLDFWPLRRGNRATLREKIPLLVIGVIFGGILVLSHGQTVGVSTRSRAECRSHS